MSLVLIVCAYIFRANESSITLNDRNRSQGTLSWVVKSTCNKNVEGSLLMCHLDTVANRRRQPHTDGYPFTLTPYT